jgi:hypothetical protein
MKPKIDSDPACRFCKHYSPEGRRGGVCQVLNVPVQGQWTACPLMVLSLSEVWGHAVVELPQPVLTRSPLKSDSYPISA